MDGKFNFSEETVMPLIALTPSWNDEKRQMCLGPDYIDAVQRAGGAPVLLSFTDSEALADEMLSRMDGVLFTGGGDVNPARYGEEMLPCCGAPADNRDQLETLLLRCALLKGLIFGGVAMASMYVAIAIYMMTPLSNSAVDILMPLVKNAGTSGILLDDATYAQLMDATAPVMVIFGVLFLVLAAPVFYRYRMANYLIIDRPATGALAALRDSRVMTKGNRWNLFRLDLSMWWYYAAMLVSIAVNYGDQLLPDLGITLPFSDTVAYFLFFGVYLAVTFVIFYFLRNRVEVTYALAYDSLRPREPENNGAVLGNIFQM